MVYAQSDFNLSDMTLILSLVLICHITFFCREDRLQDSKLGMDPFSSVITPTKLPISRSSSSSICDTVEASPGEVTHQDKLALLVSLYSKCLDGKCSVNALSMKFNLLLKYI